MHTLLALGLSAARRLGATLVSVILPTPDHPTGPTTPATHQRPTAGLTTNQVQRVTFGLDGTTYEVDLSPADAAALREDLAPWVENAHRASQPTATTTTRRITSAPPAGPPTTTAIRQWARANGHTVSDRGRLPATVTHAYRAAH